MTPRKWHAQDVHGDLVVPRCGFLTELRKKFERFVHRGRCGGSMRNMPILTDPKLRPAIDELLSYESHQAKSAVQRLRFLEFPSSPSSLRLPASAMHKSKKPRKSLICRAFIVELLGSSQRGIIPTLLLFAQKSSRISMHYPCTTE